VLVDAYRAMRPTITAAQAKPGADWIWDEGYAPVREEAGLVLAGGNTTEAPTRSEGIVPPPRD
jgi:hypothetical protein